MNGARVSELDFTAICDCDYASRLMVSHWVTQDINLGDIFEWQVSLRSVQAHAWGNYEVSDEIMEKMG